MKFSDQQLKQFEEKLLTQKMQFEKGLRSFAEKDTNVQGDWQTRFPHYEEGNTNLEEAADEVEEYATNLPIEHSLELRLQAINKALEKIKNGSYGTCQNCEEAIDPKRLEIFPEAAYCLNCRAR